MRAERIIRTSVAVVTVLAAARAGHTQTRGPAPNVTAVVRGGVVIVSYDLPSTDPAANFSVALEVSDDGGKTYNVRPRTLSGDIGAAVRAGTGKQITWEAARDVENLQLDRYRYRVMTEMVRGQSTPVRGQPAAAPPIARPAEAAAVSKPGGGNGGKWGGIVMMGAGGGLAVLGMTALKKDDYLTNKPLVFAGLGLAGGGVAVLAVSGRKASASPQIAIGPHGFMVRHALPFEGIARAFKTVIGGGASR